MRSLRMSLVILYSGVLLLFGCDAGSNYTAHEHNVRAQTYLDKAEHQAAVIELKNALQKDSANTQARLMMGQLYLTLGDGASAEKELRRAGELGVDAESIQASLARAFLLQGKFQAVSELELSHDLTSATRAELHTLRGTAMLYQENLEEAESDFQQALAEDNNSVEARVGKARLAVVRGDLKQARQQLVSAFTLDEHDADAWSLLGDIEQYEGNLKAAEEAYTTASENRVANAEDILNRVIMRIGLGQYDKANADIRQLKNRGRGIPGIDYTEGMLHFAQQRYAEAQSAFENVLARDSNNVPALFYAGAACFMQGNMEQASHYLSRFVAHRPDYGPALKMLSWINLKNARFAEAQRLIQPVVRQNPEDVFALNLLGNALMRQSKTAEGLDYFRQVVALKPDSAAARMNLGLGMIMLGEASNGIDELEKAEQLYPESEVATIRIIQTYLTNKSFDQAVETALSYRDNHTESVTARILLGTAYMGKGDTANAGKVFEEARSIDPGNISANSGLAAIALQAGKLDEAKSYYSNALDKNPGTMSTLMNLAAVEEAQGNLDAMQEALEQAIAANPEALAPRLALSRLYFRTGAHQRVVDLLSPMRAAHSDNPALLALLGESELAVGDYRGSVGDLSRLVVLVPDNANAHYLLARAYAGVRDRDGFHAELNKALELNATHLRARSDLAMLMLSEKNTAEARKHIDLLKEQTGDQPGTLVLEGRFASLTGDTKHAIETYRQAFEKERTNINLLLYEEVLWDSGNRDGAVKQLEAWIQEYPEDHLTLAQMGSRYLALEQEKKAISAYTRASELAPDNVVVLNNLAWLYQNRDNVKALEYANRAYALAPESPQVIDTIAVIVGKSDTGRASKLIEKALEKEPDNPTFLFHKALILKEAGETDQALQIVQSLVEQDRQFPEKGQARQLLQDLGGG